MKKKGIYLLALHGLLVLLSFTDCLSKLAARQAFLSRGFVLCYGGVIFLLGVYAVLWQQIIKRLPLTVAYANRAVTVVWGIVWGALLFAEPVTPGKLAGAALIIAGVVLFALSDREETPDE